MNEEHKALLSKRRAAARARGVKFGRPRKMTEAEIEALKLDVKAGGLSMQAIGDKYGIARGTVYRLAGREVRGD